VVVTDPRPLPVDARNLYRFFHAGDDEVVALKDISLGVERGEIVAVTGPSGAGKSTLLACLAGIEEPDAGRVVIDGERITRRPEGVRSAIRSRRVGTLFQSGNLVSHLSVTANIRLVRELAGAEAGDIDGLLARMRLERRAQARPTTLSGGEAARAGLAVALANNPAVLLADEPTGELDAVSAGVLLSLFEELAAQGTALIIATHSAAVSAIANRELHLRDGQAT
jgi:putative ABC transport system ATP-binding protein